MIHSFLLIGQSNMAGRGFVSARGLSANPDNLHFNAPSLREFGARYYNEFHKLEDNNKVFLEKPSEDLAIINAFEAL